MKIICCLLSGALLLISGCTDSSDKKVVGTWQELNNPQGRLVFRSDHTGLAYWPGQSGKQEMSEMSWRMLKDESRVSVITAPGPVDFEIRSDQLVAPNGAILDKVK